MINKIISTIYRLIERSAFQLSDDILYRSVISLLGLPLSTQAGQTKVGVDTINHNLITHSFIIPKP